MVNNRYVLLLAATSVFVANVVSAQECAKGDARANSRDRREVSNDSAWPKIQSASDKELAAQRKPKQKRRANMSDKEREVVAAKYEQRLARKQMKKRAMAGDGCGDVLASLSEEERRAVKSHKAGRRHASSHSKKRYRHRIRKHH